MLLDLDKFYNSNYKDFVHKEALEEALKYVPEAFLKDVDTKAILSITFSVDDVGENPIYVTYLDKDNNEHIVKLRPNITEQLTEVLKRYPTKVEMSEALEELKATITNEYTIFVNAEVETLNNTINNVNNALTQSIKDTLDEAKHYTDNLKDELTPEIAENKNRLYIGNVDSEKTEIEKTGHVTFEVNDGIKAIEVKQNDTEELPAERIDFDDYAKKSDIPTNTVTTDYLNQQLESYETKADATIDHDKLTNVPNGKKNPYISWYPNIGSEYIRIVKDNDEIKLHINNSETGLETAGYLSRRNPTNFATTTDIEPLTSKLSNIWASHKAPFIYWLPNIDINTIKLENAENDVKVTLNDGDVVYWRKNEYQPVDLSKYATKEEVTTISEYNNGTKTVDELLVRTGGVYSADYDENSCLGFLLNGRARYASCISLTELGTDYIVNRLKIKPKITNNDITYYPTDIITLPATDEIALLTSTSLQNLLTTSNTYSKTEIEAIGQEQNATQIENVPVSLQQKTRSNQVIINNSTLTETKDFKILNLDFSFVPTTLPTSVESEFVQNVIINAPEFVGKPFTITYKVNEHTNTSKGVIGDPLTIKTCALPVDETIKSIEVIVKEKIIIRKETE